MARNTGRPALVVSTEERSRLARWKDSRKAPKRAVERAAILLGYARAATAPRRYKRRWVEPAHHLQMHRRIDVDQALVVGQRVEPIGHRDMAPMDGTSNRSVS